VGAIEEEEEVELISKKKHFMSSISRSSQTIKKNKFKKKKKVVQLDSGRTRHDRCQSFAVRDSCQIVFSSLKSRNKIYSSD